MSNGNSSSSVPVLLLACGRFTIGIDAGQVRRVDPPSAEDTTSGAFLLGSESAPDSKPRTVEINSGARTCRIVADAVLGMHHLSISQLQRLPDSVRAFGAPAWIMGTTWIENRCVWLLDLSAAITATQQGEAR